MSRAHIQFAMKVTLTCLDVFIEYQT